MDAIEKDDLSHYQAKAEEKRDRAKAAADAEYLAAIQSIALLKSLVNEPSGSHVTTHVHTATVAKSAKKSRRVGGRKNGPTAAVRAAVEKLGDGFSVASLSDYFESHPDKSVSTAAIYSALNKMSGVNEIEKIQNPNGTRSRAYRIVKLKEIQ